MKTTAAMDWSKYSARLPVISSATGAVKHTKNYRDLLRSAVEDILINPIIWEDVINGVAYISRFSDASMLPILAVGTTAAGHLSNGLRQRGWATETSELHQNPPHSLRGPGPTQSSEAHSYGLGKPRIAIVGISGRFPEANDLDAFWDILFQGLDVHKVVPDSRWRAATHVDPTGSRKNTSRTPYGCWLKEPGAFDAPFFSTTPREAFQIDPASRLALMTAYEAMENAGFVPGATRSTQKHRVGVAFGVTSNDWMEVNSAQNIDTFFIPGGCRAFIPGRINYVFNLSGPSYSVDTACSSSLSAIHIACNSIWQGDADTMIAGGTNILTNPDYTAGLDRGHFLSRTGNCKSFDETADGYCRAEGVCTIILKRLEDALAENDPILGVILGASTNHSAEAHSITRPLVGAQQKVLSEVLHQSNVDASEISYVEMHGTGTRVGDPIEMESVVSTFAPSQGRGSRESENPLYVGAVKSNVGHGEAAAGVTSLAKVLLMMKHCTIPPHAGLRTTLNKSFPADMDERNVRIARTPLAWESRHSTRRKAIINNFSAAGGNTSLLVEEAPERFIPGGTDPRGTHIVTVSAKSGTSLRRNTESLIAFIGADLKASTGATLPNISYTATARRSHYPFRLAVHGSSLKHVHAHLEAALARGEGSTRVRGSPKITFAFTGTGSQYAGMGQQLYEYYPIFRAHLDRLDRLVQSQGFQSIIQFCCSTNGPTEGSDVVTMQLATVCLELALSRLWISWGIKPSNVIGHSLGEYAALAVAGVFSEAEAIFLVGRRAKLLMQRCQEDTHAMLAVRAPLSAIQACIADGAEIACINGPEDIVLAGTVGEISEAFDRLKQQSIKACPVSGIHYAFHSAQVDPILDELVATCDNVAFHKPKIPVLSPLLGAVVTEAGPISPHYLRRHCRETVNMLGVLRSAHAAGAINSPGAVLEIGPSPLICRMAQNTLGSVVPALASLKKNQDSLSVMAESVSALYTLGCDIDWKEYHSGFPMSHTTVQLPSYSWDLKEYWIQYTNDWSLRKGDPVPENLEAPITFTLHSGDPQLAASGPEADNVPKLQSSTIHQVLHDALDGNTCKIVVETDLSLEDISFLARGHRVNGVPLITPSLYAEIALRIGQHISDKYQPCLKGLTISVDDMTIERALVAYDGPEPQLLRSTINFDTREYFATCSFETLDPRTQSLRQHSHCKIHFRDRSSALAALLDTCAQPSKDRVEALGKAVGTGLAYRFSKSMIYKVVGSLAQFSPDYRQVDEIVLNSETMEASSKIDFSGLKSDGSFHTHPAAIDALSQSAGFIMNGNDAADLETEVFVNHGWKSFQLFENISRSKHYTTYCAMRRGPTKSWEGDCIVFDGDVIVAWFGGINLQGVPRRVLSYILAQESGSRPAPSNGEAFSRPPVSKKSLAPDSTPELDVVLSSTAQTPVNTVACPQHVGESALATSGVVASPGPGHSDRILQMLRILSEETGIPEDELSYNNQLADLGIDSLLMLQLASRLSEEMQVDIGSDDFARMQSIGDLLGVMEGENSMQIGNGNPIFQPTPGQPQAVHDVLVKQLGVDISLQRPSDTMRVSVTSPTELATQPGVPMANFGSMRSRQESTDDAKITKALQILSEETGVRVDELADDLLFSDLGVDSLLSLMILARYRESLGLEDDAPSDVPFFTRISTVGELRHFVSSSTGVRGPANTATVSTRASTSTSTATSKESTLYEVTQNSKTGVFLQPQPNRPASSVILQGRPKTDPYTLFLFPDGSGSATSYVGIGPVRSGLAIVGLNCPYARHPEEMELVTLDALMKSYLDEIRRRQPWGPYRLGGWSAGGILAFRAAQILIQEGMQVDSLVLIDSPPPTGLDPLPERWYEHCDAAGLFGSTTMPGTKPARNSTSRSESYSTATLVAHFRAQVNILHGYVAEPLPAGFTPRTSILWAGECVFDGRPGRPVFQHQPEDPEGIKFLTQRRVDETAGAWGPLFPLDEPCVTVLGGEDHFSMMQSENGKRLAEFISEAAI